MFFLCLKATQVRVYVQSFCLSLDELKPQYIIQNFAIDFECFLQSTSNPYPKAICSLSASETSKIHTQPAWSASLPPKVYIENFNVLSHGFLSPKLSFISKIDGVQ